MRDDVYEFMLVTHHFGCSSCSRLLCNHLNTFRACLHLCLPLERCCVTSLPLVLAPKNLCYCTTTACIAHSFGAVEARAPFSWILLPNTTRGLIFAFAAEHVAKCLTWQRIGFTAHTRVPGQPLHTPSTETELNHGHLLQSSSLPTNHLLIKQVFWSAVVWTF